MSTKYFEIGIDKMRVFALHGYYSEEQKIGKIFLIDVKLSFQIDVNKSITEITETINYEILTKIIQEEMKITSPLLETVAERMMKKFTANFKFNTAEIKISKLNPPLGISINSTFIQLIQHN